MTWNNIYVFLFQADGKKKREVPDKMEPSEEQGKAAKRPKTMYDYVKKKAFDKVNLCDTVVEPRKSASKKNSYACRMALAQVNDESFKPLPDATLDSTVEAAKMVFGEKHKLEKVRISVGLCKYFH